MNQSKRFQIAPPIWHFSKSAAGKIIIVIDKQKPGELVHEYRGRVVSLFRSRRMSEIYDQHFMCRVFLGGLRESILNEVLKRRVPELTFGVAALLAEQMENSLIHYWEPCAAIEFVERTSTHGHAGEVGAGPAAQPGVGTDGVSGENAVALDVVSGIVWNDADQDPMEKDGVDRTVAKVVATRAAEGDTAAAAPTPFLIQDNIEFFGEPNDRIDKMYNAQYILILYR